MLKRLSLRRFARDRSAVAALEFAMVAPAMLAILAGIYEVSRAVDTARRLTFVANAQANMLASAQNPTDATSVTYAELHYAYDSAMLMFPEVLRDSASKNLAWSKDITISMSGISFTPTPSTCTSNCTYQANIVWTGADMGRACGTHPVSQSNTALPASGYLPADLFTTVANPSGTAGPLFAVVVDVTYSWKTLIFSKIVGPITMTRSAYVNPRYASQITYKKAVTDDAFGKQCP